MSSVVRSRRWLIVVAENQPSLLQGLRLSFANDPTVEVVLDRRGAAPEPAAEATQERRQPLSAEQTVVWRELKFLLVDRWKGMEVYEAAAPQPPAQ